MPIFAVHKILFLHNDDYYKPVPMMEGSVVKSFDNRAEAEKEKQKQDILSLKKLKGENMADFIAHLKNPQAIFKKLSDHCQKEFDMQPLDSRYFELPHAFDNQQAQKILDVTGLSFHEVIEHAIVQVFFPISMHLTRTGIYSNFKQECTLLTANANG